MVLTMMDFSELLEISPYSLNKQEKSDLLLRRLEDLTNLHYENCEQYRRMIDAFQYNRHNIATLEDLPMVPVQMFKDMELKSISDEDVFKTMTSSGTTGQQVSKIFLDKQTSSNQQKTLVKIVKEFTGSGRMPMLIIDSPSVVKNRLMFSARGAGILGFSIFASDKAYALDDDMRIDFEGIATFLEKHQGKKILLFGFTFMIWQYFYKELLKSEKYIDLSNGVLIHGGGWKKLKNEAVEPAQFKNELNRVCGLTHIHDYYGMVEQTGCVYMECECGHLHASIFSDLLIRRAEDFSLCDIGEEGIIQVLSTIPESYPGHSILTEDKGIILGEDDCPCGRLGKYFKITGRIKNAEIRGCSDTYEHK
jgi:phenylacetate-coenzyme A ligase PaaK-like adenylate-forming protein